MNKAFACCPIESPNHGSSPFVHQPDRVKQPPKITTVNKKQKYGIIGLPVDLRNLE